MQITIVIPVYNRREYIARTLASIPDSYPVILVDNGSTDGSRELCESLANERRNTTFAEEPTEGAAAARNRGLALCQTEWVYFFDSDDVFEELPSGQALGTVAGMDLVCFPVKMTVNGKTSVRTYRPVSNPVVHIANSMLGTQSMLFRTEWLRQIGGWDNRCRIWDDWELGLRALLSNPRMKWLTDRAFHNIIVHPDSLTGSSFSMRQQRIAEAFAVALEDVRRLATDATLRHRCERALAERCHIIAGTMEYECNSAAAQRLMESFFGSGTLSIPRPLLLYCKFLRWYSAHGGRGAWRLIC